MCTYNFSKLLVIGFESKLTLVSLIYKFTEPQEVSYVFCMFVLKQTGYS